MGNLGQLAGYAANQFGMGYSADEEARRAYQRALGQGLWTTQAGLKPKCKKCV